MHLCSLCVHRRKRNATLSRRKAGNAPVPSALFLFDWEDAILAFVKTQQFAKEFARFGCAGLEWVGVLVRVFWSGIFEVGEVDGGQDQHGALGEIEVRIELVGNTQ